MRAPWSPALKDPFGLYGSLIIGGVLIVFMSWAALRSVAYPFTPDSSLYIEAARNLAAGKGLLVPAGIEDLSHEMVPLALFPPGYPVAIAGIATLGVPEPKAALWIARAAAALLPAALAFALRAVLSDVAVLTCGLLVATSPGVLVYGYLGLSDVPFMVLVVVSLGAFIRSFGRRGWFGGLLLSGLLAGTAYAVRNAGVATLVAVPGAVVAAVISRIVPCRRAVADTAWWAAGVSAVLLPVFSRNLRLFGKVQPYQMPASDTAVLANVKQMAHSVLFDVSGSWRLAGLGWRLTVLLPILVAALALWLFLVREARLRWSERSWIAVFVLGFYLVSGLTVLIVARSRYRWGEPINVRYVMQYSWTVLALVAVVWPGPRPSRNLTIAGAIVLAAALFAGRGVVFGRLVADERETARALGDTALWIRDLPRSPLLGLQIRRRVAEDREALEAIRATPLDAFIVSNVAEVPRIETGRRVRGMDAGDFGGTAGMMGAIVQAARQTGPRPFYAVLVPWEEATSASGGLDLRAALASGCLVVSTTTPTAVILSRPDPRPCP